MSDDKKTGTTTANVGEIGRKARNEKFPVVRTEADVQADIDAQKPFAHPDAMDIDTYFSIKRINAPHVRAAMKAYTQVRKATVAAFDDIFKTF